MNSKQDMLELLIDWVENHAQNGIKQHSDEWHIARVGTIGGSSLATIQGVNPHSSVVKLFNEKIGVTKFMGDIAPQWGTMFEDVIKRVVEYQHKCVILGEDLFIRGCGVYDKLSYSPDGFAVVNWDNCIGVAGSDPAPTGNHITLMEFKCPYSRIPNGQPPKYYIPQVKMGLELLQLPTVGMFVEAVFRRCSWDQIGFDATCDVELAKTGSKPTPHAYGLLGFYISGKINCDERWYEEYTDVYGDPDCGVVHDLGACSGKLFKLIMGAVDRKQIGVYYGNIVHVDSTGAYLQMNIPPEMALHTTANHRMIDNVPACMQEELRDYVQFCNDNGYINVGILPWKLFQIDYHRIDLEANYLAPWLDKIHDVLRTVEMCQDPANECRKSNIIDSFMEKNGKGFIM